MDEVSKIERRVVTSRTTTITEQWVKNNLDAEVSGNFVAENFSNRSKLEKPFLGDGFHSASTLELKAQLYREYHVQICDSFEIYLQISGLKMS